MDVGWGRMKKLGGSGEISEVRGDNSLSSQVSWDLSPELRALAAIIVNMLHRHSHAERQAVLKFALEKECEIPVSQSSVFSGTSLMPRRR